MQANYDRFPHCLVTNDGKWGGWKSLVASESMKMSRWKTNAGFLRAKIDFKSAG